MRVLQYMMTSSNGNIFRFTGHLWGGGGGNSHVTGEFPAQRPVTRSFDVFFDLRLNKRLSKQSWGWWFETLSRPLWRHCNVMSFHVTGGQWCHRPHVLGQSWGDVAHTTCLQTLRLETRLGPGGGNGGRHGSWLHCLQGYRLGPWVTPGLMPMLYVVVVVVVVLIVVVAVVNADVVVGRCGIWWHLQGLFCVCVRPKSLVLSCEVPSSL